MTTNSNSLIGPNSENESPKSESPTELSEALMTQKDPTILAPKLESEVVSDSSILVELAASYSAKSIDEIHREQTLDFSGLSANLTIAEVQEEAQILEEENEAAESPLDRYVRKHRDMVESGKSALGRDRSDSTEFESLAAAAALVGASMGAGSTENKTENEAENSKENSVEDSIEGSTETLKENSIENSAEITNPNKLDPVAIEGEGESAKSEEDPELMYGELVDTTIFPAPTLEEQIESEKAADKKFDKLSVVDAPEEVAAPPLAPASSLSKRSKRHSQEATYAELTDEVATAADENSKNESVAAVAGNESSKKSKTKPIVIGLVAIAVITAGAYAGFKIYQDDQARTNAAASKTNQEIATFKKNYDAFFTDSTHQVLKNSHFDKLSALGNDLDVVPTTSSEFAGFQVNYNNLANDISAVKSVNALFDKPAINDGKLDTTVLLKSGVTLPTVSSKNSDLNTLLQQALELAKSQETSASSSASKAASSASASQSQAASSAAQNASSAGNGTGASSGAGGTTTTSSAASSTNTIAPPGTAYSQNPSGATPNNSYSRVPVQTIDAKSAAFQWTPGVLDQTIASMQSRGYISGSNYILEPVAIDKAGNGWYNIYRPDGSYLFSINCKTGFWAGNGGKYPTLPATF